MRAYHLCLVNSVRGWGGAEVWFLETAAALQQRGVTASLVAQPGSELHSRARDAGVPVHPLPIRFDAAPWTLYKLRRHFLAAGVTAVVANLTKDLKAAAAAGRLARIPHLLASRESDFPLKSKLYYRWYFNHLASGMLVNSQATRQTVLDSARWLDPDRVHLLYKGIDLDRFQPTPKAPRQPVVGFAGQLITRKGLREIMTAWEGVTATPRAETPVLRLAGTGPLREELETWRSHLKDPASVQLLGQVEDMESFYNGLNLLVMPSHSEGFGLAAAEAAACGIPVVAASSSSLPEIVVHEKTGLLVPAGDAAALRRAVDRLLTDPVLAATLGRAGRDRVARYFDREKTLDRLLALTGWRPHS